MGSKLKITDAQLREMVRLYNTGTSQGDIAKNFGISRGSVQNYLKKADAMLPDDEMVKPAPKTPFKGKYSDNPRAMAAKRTPDPSISEEVPEPKQGDLFSPSDEVNKAVEEQGVEPAPKSLTTKGSSLVRQRTGKEADPFKGDSLDKALSLLGDPETMAAIIGLFKQYSVDNPGISKHRLDELERRAAKPVVIGTGDFDAQNKAMRKSDKYRNATQKQQKGMVQDLYDRHSSPDALRIQEAKDQLAEDPRTFASFDKFSDFMATISEDSGEAIELARNLSDKANQLLAPFFDKGVWNRLPLNALQRAFIKHGVIDKRGEHTHGETSRGDNFFRPLDEAFVTDIAKDMVKIEAVRKNADPSTLNTDDLAQGETATGFGGTQRDNMRGQYLNQTIPDPDGLNPAQLGQWRRHFGDKLKSWGMKRDKATGFVTDIDAQVEQREEPLGIQEATKDALKPKAEPQAPKTPFRRGRAAKPSKGGGVQSFLDNVRSTIEANKGNAPAKPAVARPQAQIANQPTGPNPLDELEKLREENRQLREQVAVKPKKAPKAKAKSIIPETKPKPILDVDKLSPKDKLVNRATEANTLIKKIEAGEKLSPKELASARHSAENARIAKETVYGKKQLKEARASMKKSPNNMSQYHKDIIRAESVNVDLRKNKSAPNLLESEEPKKTKKVGGKAKPPGPKQRATLRPNLGFFEDFSSRHSRSGGGGGLGGEDPMSRTGKGRPRLRKPLLACGGEVKKKGGGRTGFLRRG